MLAFAPLAIDSMLALAPLESTGLSYWFWVLVLLGVIWLKRHLDVYIASREHILSSADAPQDRKALPPLSMLVAGKEEEENIERCVRGLLAQDYPQLEVIAINDRSEDRTGAIIDRLATEDERFRALHVDHLPDGWFGKNNAMRLGVEQSSHDWLCFTDADCVFDSPDLLAASVAYAQREGIEFLSVLPRLEAITAAEKIVQPVAGAILVYWNPPQKVNNPKSSAAYANGAFMLMTRQAYEKLGGHEAVKATLNEDMHFARRAKALGVPFRVIRSADMYRVRMYTTLNQIWRGWSRIFYGCFGTPARLIASFLLLLLASMSPYLTLLLSPLAGNDAGWLALAAGWAILCQQSIMWRYYPISGLPAPWALTYPLGTGVVLGLLLNALAKSFGATRTNWRGTVYTAGH